MQRRDEVVNSFGDVFLKRAMIKEIGDVVKRLVTYKHTHTHRYKDGNADVKSNVHKRTRRAALY